MNPFWASTPHILNDISYLENGTNFFFDINEKFQNMYNFGYFYQYPLSYGLSLKIVLFIHFCWSIINISKDYIPSKYSFLFACLFSNLILLFIILF